ncbi:acetyl-CoA carboxylase biotin carboxyl carrier protein [Nocardiopsis sp. CNT-189]
MTMPELGRKDTAPDTSGSIDAALAELGAQAALEALVRSVADVASAGAVPPRRLSVRFGCAAIDVDWSDPGVPEQAGRPLPAAAAAVPAAEPAASADGDDGLEAVKAPLVGTFYRAPEPGAPPFVEVGDEVKPGQQVAIIEAMKLMNSVEADIAGRVVEVLPADGDPVEYDQRLIVIEPLEEG